MKNKFKKRMTLKEKIEASALLKRGIVADPRVMKDVPPGCYTITGHAAAELAHKEAARAARLLVE